MTNSGHCKQYINNVIMSGTQKYNKKYQKSILQTSHKDYKSLHLGTNYNTLGRWRRKMLEKNNWYKDNEDGNSERKGRMKKGSKQDEKRRLKQAQSSLSQQLREAN